MSKPAVRKPGTSRNQPVVKKAPLSFQQQVEKWFLPFLLVVISSVIVGTFVRAYLVPGK